MKRLVTFGEIMLRLSPPGRELPLQSLKLDVWLSGAEANVATALARLDHEVAMVSAIPDTALGDGAVATLRGHGVDTRAILRRPGRMGLCFVINGAGMRATEVTYDRAGSAFASVPARDWRWDEVLDGADRLHLSGITPALGPAARESALAAAEAASRLGVPLSFDGNYRSRLWDMWDGQPQKTLNGLVSHADILFGNRRDIGLLLGTPFDRDEDAVVAAFAAFPRLQMIARTDRQAIDADQNLLSAAIDVRDRAVRSPDLKISGIVDRIGTGDAFAAGVLDALRRGAGLEDVAANGLALAALKHTLPGDASLFGRRDLDAFRAGGFDVRR